MAARGKIPAAKKAKRSRKNSTCNRVPTVAGAVLNRCASDDWKKMIPPAPHIPLFQLDKIAPKWMLSCR